VKSASRWLYQFLPAPIAVSNTEQLRACCGALLGILLTSVLTRLILGSNDGLPLLVAPMGASAVLLFALPSSPLAQPWPLIGGHAISATVGVTCSHWIGDPSLAACVAVAGALAAMFALRCLHPPCGGTALVAALGGPTIVADGYHFVLFPVVFNALLLLLVAILFNNATRRRYPHAPHIDHSIVPLTADTHTLGFTVDDLDEVLKQYNQVLDIDRDDLEKLFLQIEMRAHQRKTDERTRRGMQIRELAAFNDR
jgi:CBS domain-containing membrane protein